MEIGQEPRQPAAEPAERTPAAPERPADRQGSVARQFGPFEDPGLNHYYAAVLAGDAALANRIAFGFSFRAPAEREAQATLETPAEPLEAQVAQSVRAQEAPSLHI